MKNKLIPLAFLLAFLPLRMTAQDSVNVVRPSSDYRVLMFGIGANNILDTYLSPEKYTGEDLRIITQSRRQWKKHPSWYVYTTSMGTLESASPRSEDSDYIGGMYTFAYGLRREWSLGNRWQVEAGAQAEAGAGFLYSTRNGNNPAQARLYLNIAPIAAASYQFRLFRKKMIARYEVAAPLLGILFSPNYGQSYYEIFTRGDYDHNAVFTTPFCAPSLRQSLAVDITFSKKNIFRIGYLGDYQQAEVNSLKYHTYTHAVLFGFVRNLNILKP